ncbi:MAG: hypothetical protein K0R25_637 [Rickettsiaceae bacterium]|jgi:hypothetical protein|nr:hypothetical protein [Rickettsiaceae bacterium]
MNKLNLFCEKVKSEFTQEKIIACLQRHKNSIIYLVVFALLALVLVLSFNFYNQVQSKKYSAILHQALVDEQNGEMEKSNEALKKIYNSMAPVGVREIASLKYASQLVKDKKIEQAIDVYLRISKSKNFDPYIKEYAGLVAIKFLINQNNKESHDKIRALLTDLEKNSKTLKYYVTEQKGIFEWNAGNFKEAGKIFKELDSNKDIPDALKKRTEEMLGLYKVRFGEEVEESADKDKAKVEEKTEAKTESKDEKKSEEEKKEDKK